jgi:hypothetical protein
MKLWILAAVGCLFSNLPLPAQTSIQVLEQDLQDVKQKHDDANSQLVTTFLSTLDSASQSPSTALELYKSAGGSLPDLSPVRKYYEYETPSEKAVRDAQDATTFAAAAVVIQVHCGLMHYAALLTINPKAPGLQENWLNWLRTAGQMYPQLQGKRALKDVAMRDSVISSYLGFRGWGDKDPGKWALHDLPQLYHDLILEPARHPPTAATLDLWDTYIAMRQADQPDHDKWAQEDEPPLDFDRGSDDFATQPSMEKLSTLIAIIKANPSHSQLDDWIARMKTMIRSYQGGAVAPATGQLPGATPGTPSSEAAGTLPAATPGTPSSAAGGDTPAATPGTPSSATGGPIPAATTGNP